MMKEYSRCQKQLATWNPDVKAQCPSKQHGFDSVVCERDFERCGSIPSSCNSEQSTASDPSQFGCDSSDISFTSHRSLNSIASITVRSKTFVDVGAEKFDSMASSPCLTPWQSSKSSSAASHDHTSAPDLLMHEDHIKA